MNTLRIFFGLAIFAMWSVVHAQPLEPIIDGSTLVDLIEKNHVKVLEIRSDEQAYIKQHIPGSVHLSYGKFRGPKNNPGKLPELTQIAEALGSRGLDITDSVVVVHNGITTTDFGAAARVYWTLKSVGFTSISILNGGFDGYLKGGFPTTSEATPVTTTLPKISFDSTWYVNSNQIAEQISGQGQAKFLDARLDSFYEGKAWHGAAKRPGILPGADQFSFQAFFDKNTPNLKSRDELRLIVTDNELDQPGTVSYCNTGHWAATNWFVLSEVVGVPDIKLYAESMVEWSAQDRPMDNTPSSLEFALLKSKKWFNGLVN